MLIFDVETMDFPRPRPQTAANSTDYVRGAGREIEIIGSHGMAASDFPAILKMVRWCCDILTNEEKAARWMTVVLLTGGRRTLEAARSG